MRRCGAVLLLLAAGTLWGQGYDDTFEMKSKLKVELQYADYFEYEYPEPIFYRYGIQEYSQLRPYLANFPEKRMLTKYTRKAGQGSAVSIKYQFSDLRRDVNSHLGELKWTSTLKPGVVGLAGIQLVTDSRGFNAWQPGFGIRWDVSHLTMVQADAQYYTRGVDAVEVGGALGSLNLRVKVRQVVAMSTAVMMEYLFYDADGDALSFTSHTVSLWLSQFVAATQSALHLNLRYYDNSLGIRSWAPSVELAQYLNWATVIRLKYRYYQNESGNNSLGEADVIVPDGLTSHAVSAQVNRELNTELMGYLKYRYYKSNQGIAMNTYLLGFVYSF